MKRIRISRFLLTVSIGFVWVVATAAQQSHYMVSIDTIGKYLDVELSATRLEGTQTMLKLLALAPGYYIITT